MQSSLKLLTLLILVLAAPAWATNGYFSHGKGTRSKGMAGAGTAQPAGATELANNPASAILIGNHFELGAAIFSPRRSYASSDSLANGNGGAFTIGPNNLDSVREGFFIPHVAGNWDRGNYALGFALYGRGGMNTDWKGGTASFDPDGPGPSSTQVLPGTYGAGNAGVDLSQAFVDLVYARRENDRFAWGIAAVLAAQSFEATGLSSFAPFTKTFATSSGSTFPTALSDRGRELSYGGGIRLGIHSILSPTIRFSLSYQSKLYMTPFDDYSDLFAEQGDFDIPANLNSGLSFAYNDKLSIALDIEHTWFSDVEAVGNPVAKIFSCPTSGAGGTDIESCLGGNNGAGFGWNDVTTFKVGAEWQLNDHWTWRGGVSHAGQPIPATDVIFNILAPGVIENHYTLGFTRRIGKNGELNAAAMYAPEKRVSGTNVFDPSQQIELRMHQYELEFSYGHRF